MPLKPILQTLHQTQLSASNVHTQVRQDARKPSSASHPRKSRSSRTSTVATQDPDFKAELEDVTTKLVALGVPWSKLWVIHGAWTVAAPNEKQPEQQVTGMDDLGIKVVSHVPQHLLQAFLSEVGQLIVSISYGPIPIIHNHLTYYYR